MTMKWCGCQTLKCMWKEQYLPRWRPYATSQYFSPNSTSVLHMETLHTHHMLKQRWSVLLHGLCISDSTHTNMHMHIYRTHTYTDASAQTYLQISPSSRPWGSAPPCESHAGTCKLEGGGNAARRSGPPGTPCGRLGRGATRPPQLRSTPAVDRAPCRTAPGCSPAPPPDSLRTQTLAHYLEERWYCQHQHQYVQCCIVQSSWAYGSTTPY